MIYVTGDTHGKDVYKRQVYEDCGWEYVISRGYLHIFRAPEGNDAPEFYLEPEQQAATLKAVSYTHL